MWNELDLLALGPIAIMVIVGLQLWLGDRRR